MITNHEIHFQTGRHTKKRLAKGAAKPRKPVSRIAHISKLMALAIRLEQLIRDGDVTDQAELAKLGHVSRARLTQIMNLLQLAPDIQEQILFLPPCERGNDAVTESVLRPIAANLDWHSQRLLFESHTRRIRSV